MKNSWEPSQTNKKIDITRKLKKVPVQINPTRRAIRHYNLNEKNFKYYKSIKKNIVTYKGNSHVKLMYL